MRLCLYSFVGAVILAPILGVAQTPGCQSAQDRLKEMLQLTPDASVTALENAVRASPECAGSLVSTAISATTASDEMISRLVGTALRIAPSQVVSIAESAITASPNSSDAVAKIVQEVMGNCETIGEDLEKTIKRAPERLLVVLEDALRTQENCVCEIVRTVISAANGDEALIRQAVAVAVNVAPSKAAEISECATAEAPSHAAAVQAGIEEALVDSDRGPGALAAAAEPLKDQKQSVEDSYEEIVPPNASVGYGKGNGEHAGYGKNASMGKNPTTQPPAESAPSWYGSAVSPNAAPVYLIAPSSVPYRPPGESTPLSPSDPKIDDKKLKNTKD